MQDDVYIHTVTYWGAPVLDGFGTRSFAAPVLLKARWEDKTDLTIYKEGEEVNSRAVVYVPSNMAMGGYLAKGDYVTGTPVADPQTIATAYMVQEYKVIPSVDGAETLRKAVL